MNKPDSSAWSDGTPTLMPDAQLPGTAGPGVRIGNFELQTLLGRGGMGEVWKAWDKKADRSVVIKLVPPELQRADEEMGRVRDTFRRIHALQHQHICPLYLLDEDPRLGWYLVMKYIDGQTLSSYRATYVARHGSFPLEEVIKVLHPVADALDYAHRQRVLHRDIKPQNVLVVGSADDVQVVDFGLAAEIRTTVSRYTRVQMDTSGTRPYMAPEQWKGQIQDAATDQYALVATAYELLAGHLPFESDDFDILRACVLNDPPEPIEGMAESVNRALLIGMGKRRQERFATCLEFIQAIEGAQASQPVRKPTPEKPAAVTLDHVAASKAVVTEPLSIITNSIGLEMLLIPAGEFLMGSTKDEVGALEREKTQHRVRITKPFYLGVYPVTQAEYERVTGKNPSRFKADERRPVEMVSWEDVLAFCRRLSGQEGATYRLPTEAEWEYACRAGTTTFFCFGDDFEQLGEYAWYSKNSNSSTHPVGQKKPNVWGLYDMHGNVWEWCADWWDENYYRQFANKVAVDPMGPLRGSIRVNRGGGWWRGASYCRSACRSGRDPGDRRGALGFRLVRTVS